MSAKRTESSLKALRSSMQQVMARIDAHTATLIDATLQDFAAAGDRLSGADFPAVRRCIQEAFVQGPPHILGMGFIGDSTAVGPHAVHWWYRPVGGRPSEPLITNSHPQLMDYYDFENSTWWQAAAADEDVHLSGPYIDLAGTNSYVVTGSHSVVRNGRFFGVVAMDIEVEELQRLWQRDLLAIGRPTSVVDAEGSVVATNSGELLGGCIDLDDVSPAQAAAVGSTPWLVVQL